MLPYGRDADYVPDTEPTVGAGLLANVPRQSHRRRQANRVRQHAGSYGSVPSADWYDAGSLLRATRIVYLTKNPL
jgi:hypothetical protein